MSRQNQSFPAPVAEAKILFPLGLVAALIYYCQERQPSPEDGFSRQFSEFLCTRRVLEDVFESRPSERDRTEMDSDLVFCIVELRGFEPLTSALRTLKG